MVPSLWLEFQKIYWTYITRFPIILVFDLHKPCIRAQVVGKSWRGKLNWLPPSLQESLRAHCNMKSDVVTASIVRFTRHPQTTGELTGNDYLTSAGNKIATAVHPSTNFLLLEEISRTIAPAQLSSEPETKCLNPNFPRQHFRLV